MSEQYDKVALVTDLLSSLIKFTKFFYKLRTGRDFIITNPAGRESHVITIAKDLVRIARNPACRHIINIPPGYSKSTMTIYFICWCMARYPDSNFIYTSYSRTLASKHTLMIRSIMSLPEFYELFGVRISDEMRSRDMFATNYGGVITSAGSGGSITGLDCGLPDLDRFSGALIIDDYHKPSEVHSDTIREREIRNYHGTLEQRLRGKNVPIIAIAQRLHESDIVGHLLSGADGYHWTRSILPALDSAGNALWPDKDDKQKLLVKKETDKYTFAAQYQQEPQPAGGALYSQDMFELLDDEPDCFYTFITVDTAESIETYSDYTAMSFWGVYNLELDGYRLPMRCLHWIDCVQEKIEPRYLKDAFIGFWTRCQQYKKAPHMAAIEKKSAGTTLVSVLKEMRGMQIREIERSAASGSKGDRFIAMQAYIAERRVSLNREARHVDMCIEHMCKIAPNLTHKHDDICDTVYDAVKIALIDNALYTNEKQQLYKDETLRQSDAIIKQRLQARRASYYGVR